MTAPPPAYLRRRGLMPDLGSTANGVRPGGCFLRAESATRAPATSFTGVGCSGRHVTEANATRLSPGPPHIRSSAPASLLTAASIRPRSVPTRRPAKTSQVFPGRSRHTSSSTGRTIERNSSPTRRRSTDTRDVTQAAARGPCGWLGPVLEERSKGVACLDTPRVLHFPSLVRIVRMRTRSSFVRQQMRDG
jgi:hypothetical protein